MKKKIKLLLFILSIFFVPFVVNAASGQLSAGDIEMECVYDNGRSLLIYYSNGAYGINISTFKLANSVTPPYSTSLSFFLNESTRAEQILRSVSCPNSIQSALIEQTKVDGDNKTSMQFEVLFVSEDAETIMNKDVKTNFVAGFTPTSGRVVGTEVVADSLLGKRLYWGHGTDDENLKSAASFKFYLKSERIYFNNDVAAKRSWAFKSEGQQAASTPEYIKLSEYVSENGTTFNVVEKDKNITKVDISLTSSDANWTIFVCFKPTVKNIKNDRNDMAYYFTSVHHSLSYKAKYEATKAKSKSAGLECSTGYSLYQEVSLDEYNENISTATSICDVIPETALLVSTLIYYLGLIVPVLLIIFTAIDITKLVISGNLDEELPKKKKLIITRFIVAVCFFFIPIIMNIFVSSNYGTDFGDISCLFQQNTTPESGEGTGD